MKLIKYSVLSLALWTLSCHNKETKNWDIELKQPLPPVELVDISQSFYDAHIPLAEFQKEYPWFQGTVSDEDYAKRRLDTREIEIYKTAKKQLNDTQLKKDLATLFAHIQYYFPKFVAPKVFLYSSAVQGVEIPVFYKPEENWLFIDMAAFMGKGNHYYQGVDLYLQESMNPENLVPTVSRALAEHIVPLDRAHRKFIDDIAYEGKLMMLQDAFLPNTSDVLKIGYSPEQEAWAKANEANIWNYFVENDLLFSDDARLIERFLAPAPFSKFYTEIDNESAPKAGVFIGWQMCRAYFKQLPDTSLAEFILKTKGEDILKQSKYKGELRPHPPPPTDYAAAAKSS